MFKKLRYIARTRAAGNLIYWFARFYCATLRFKIENESQWINYYQQGGKVLLCLWHQQLFSTIQLLSKYKKHRPSVMISKSLDGDIAARISEAAGFFAVRGSSSRGGFAALKEMIKRVNRYRMGAHILDGPQGPAGVIKPGVIALANYSGAVIVPLVVIADRAWYLRSWDRFMIPKPFTLVEIKFGPEIELPEKMDENEYENQIKKLEQIMKPYLRL
jgi:lysophospholipid acyltransferase (LPLAT)-like uncharacterized protein